MPDRIRSVIKDSDGIRSRRTGIMPDRIRTADAPNLDVIGMQSVPGSLGRGRIDAKRGRRYPDVQEFKTALGG